MWHIITSTSNIGHDEGLQETLYFFQWMNVMNDDYLKQFDAYAKVIKSYGGRTPVHPNLVKASLTKMEVPDV